MRNNTVPTDYGFTEAEHITKHFAKTFYVASRLLPPEQRKASYAIYAICRTSDESVDNTDISQRRFALDSIRQQIQAAYGTTPIRQPLLAAFYKTINAYGIPQDYFNEMLAGMEMDLIKTRYATFDELYDYCYKVAGVIGLIMVRVFGFHNQRALHHAIELGIAMQLTNIIRDIREDFSRGRIYIPLDEMKQFHVEEDVFDKESVAPELKNLLIFSAARARDYYRRAHAGIPLITNKRCRLTVATMANLYEGILDDAAKHGYNVLNRRAHVCLPHKIIRIARILTQGACS